MSATYKSGNQEFDRRIDEYFALILALALAYRDGKITRKVFEAEHIRATEAAIVAGLFISGGVISHPLARKFLIENRTIARNSARKLSKAIRDGEFTAVDVGEVDGEIDGGLAGEEERMLQKLVNRLSLWTFTVGAARVIGQLTEPPKPVRNDDGGIDLVEKKLVWTLGYAEHCGTCQAQWDKGYKPQYYWANLAYVGIMPQGGGLICGGWNCQCRLMD